MELISNITYNKWAIGSWNSCLTSQRIRHSNVQALRSVKMSQILSKTRCAAHLEHSGQSNYQFLLSPLLCILSVCVLYKGYLITKIFKEFMFHSSDLVNLEPFHLPKNSVPSSPQANQVRFCSVKKNGNRHLWEEAGLAVQADCFWGLCFWEPGLKRKTVPFPW